MRLKNQAIVFLMVLAVDFCLGAGLLSMVCGRPAGRDGRFLAASAPEPEPKLVALTFDDGPNAKYTGRLLDGLQERGIQASFFLIGESIEGNEEIIKRMDKDGHLIGVHCMSHSDLTKKDVGDACRELEETRELIAEVTGREPEYMRPPYGSWNEKLSDSVSMTPVFWSVDSVDWKLRNTPQIVKRVVKNTKDGDIILMHDEFSTSVEAAFQIIDNLLAKGYTFVTIDELSID